MDGNDVVTSSCSRTIGVGGGGDDTITVTVSINASTNIIVSLFGYFIKFYMDSPRQSIVFMDTYSSTIDGRDTLVSNAALNFMNGGKGGDNITCIGINCYVSGDQILVDYNGITKQLQMLDTQSGQFPNEDTITVGTSTMLAQQSIIIGSGGRDHIDVYGGVTLICSDQCQSTITINNSPPSSLSAHISLFLVSMRLCHSSSKYDSDDSEFPNVACHSCFWW
jgi:hypothetical protein